MQTEPVEGARRLLAQVSLLAAAGMSFTTCGSGTAASSVGPSPQAVELRRADLPPGWSTGPTAGDPTGLAGPASGCFGPGEPTPQASARSPQYSHASGAGELFVQSGAVSFAREAQTTRAMDALAAPGASGCLGGVLDDEIGPSLPPGLRIVSTTVRPAEVPVPASTRLEGFDVSIAVSGSGVSSSVEGFVVDEAHGRLVGGLTLLGVGIPFPAGLRQSLVERVGTRLAQRA